MLGGCVQGQVRIPEKVYTYNGEGFGGEFTITIKRNGDFSYSEGGLSSHIGIGTWSVEEDVLTLTENIEELLPVINHFLMDGDRLVFISKGSSNFRHIKLKDGAVFI